MELLAEAATSPANSSEWINENDHHIPWELSTLTTTESLIRPELFCH